jgi:choline kinase
VYIEEIDGLFWAEVDYIEDYERILKFRGYSADFELKIHKG